MKKRKSESYLIVSSAHLGMDDDILMVFGNIARYYGAQVYHLGPLVSDTEIRKYNKFKKDLEKARTALLVLETSDKSTPEREAKAKEKIDEIQSHFNFIVNLQKNRIKKLRKFFPNIKFITTEALSIPGTDEEFIYTGMNLSQYVFLAPIPPAGMAISGKPVQNRSLPYLKQMGKSWIAAHPIPSVECYPRPGLNQAYNFFTVGSLKHATFPLNTKQQSEFSQMPAAVFVLIDTETGEFHPRQLHIDYLNNKKPNPLMKEKNRKIFPMVLDDGLVFLGNKIIEVGPSDRATVSTDDHAPYEHPGVLGALRSLNQLYQPETFINAGDAADFTSVCHHIESSLAQREGLRLKHDIISLQLLLQAQANTPSIKHRILIDSNHHEWVTKYSDEHPELIGMIDWKTLANEVFPEWDLYIRNDRQKENDNIFYFGDFAIRHGDQENGLAKAERMFESGKYLCGHWHRYESYKRAIMQGCGAKLSPTYLNGRQTNWQSQISTLTKYNGVAACNPKIVLHDKKKPLSRFAYRGEIYEIAHYVIRHPYKKIYEKIAEKT
ncbi:MAG: hypothetical protein QXL01_00560 [Thermoplasmatales archaeon]